MCLYNLFVPFPKVKAPFLLAIYNTTNNLSSKEYLAVNTYFNAVAKEKHCYWFTLACSAAWVCSNVNNLKLLNETSGRG